jgi:hypothetical protein
MASTTRNTGRLSEMPRYSVDLTLDEVKQVKAIAKKEDRTLASTLRCLVRRQLHVGKLIENGAKQLQNSKDIDIGLRAPDSSSQKEREEKKKKGSQVAGAIASRVIGRINSLRPERINGKVVKGFSPVAYESTVGLLLKRGHTELDMVTVVEWKAEECKRRRDWQWFKPSTLFRSTKFREKLDEALAGVEVSGFDDVNKNNQINQQDYTKGVDENGNW